MMDWLHRFLVPSEKNGYRPTSLENTAAGIMLVLIVLTFTIANLQSILLISSDWFASSILPAALVDLTNVSRSDNELPDLTRSPLLDEAARQKAEDMAQEGYFSHDSPEGVTPWYWFKKVGYQYAYAGENLAVHFSDSEDVVNAWMDSPGHRANILNNHYTEIGIGTAKGTYKGTPTVFVVQLFGAPLPPDLLTERIANDVVETPALRTTPVVLAANDSTPEQTAPEVSTQPPVPASVAEPVPIDTAPLTSIEPSPMVTETPTLEVDEDREQLQDIDETDREESLMTIQNEPAPEAHPEEVVVEHGVVALVSPMATTASPYIGSLRPDQIVSTEPLSPITKMMNFLARLVTSPHTVISVSYLILSSVVAFMLAFSVVVEWRRQHPLQVAYAVGLVAVMLLVFRIHMALTTGILIT